MSASTGSPGDGIDAVIVAAGGSRRMGGLDKLEARIGGRTLLHWTIDAIARSPIVERIVLVAGHDRAAAAGRERHPRLTSVVVGGARRHESVAAGLAELDRLDAATSDHAGSVEGLVVVHDGARPLVSTGLIESVAAAARQHGAAIPLTPLADTIKRFDGDIVRETVDRSDLGAAQTPQAARRGLLRQAFERFPPDGAETWTDEAALLEACGVPVHVVTGEADNRKVTIPGDLEHVARVLGAAMPRVGIGRDGHPFGPGEPLMLCGVTIAGAPRLHGHSDGDVALHAVADAILGAAAKPDLGRRFPADERTPRGVDSRTLLADVLAGVARDGLRPVSCDLTISGARPRLADHLDDMRDALAGVLGVPASSVSVKASTGNLAGDEGAGRSMSAIAVVVLGPS